MNKFRIVLSVVLLAVYCVAAEAAPWAQRYPAQVIKVIDADTIKVRLEVFPNLFQQVNLRIAGIDTPESRRGTKGGVRISECEVADGKAAKRYAKQVIDKGLIFTVSDVDPSKSKYAGRINGQLWVDSQSFGQKMVDAGWAATYQGGTRQAWPCKTQ